MTAGEDTAFPRAGQIGYLLRRASQVHSAFDLAHLAAADLRPLQFLVLEVVMLAPGHDATRISEWTALDPAALSVMLKRLVEKGWLERRANPADRRAKLLFVTAAGDDVTRRGQQFMAAARQQIEPRLSAADWGTVTVLLQAFSRTPGGAGPQPDFPHFSDARYLMSRSHQIHSGIFAQHLAGHDLTPVQFLALDGVRRAPGVDATQLSERTALDRATLSVLLARLAAEDMVRQAPNPQDRRGKLLHVTPRGQALLDRALPDAAAARKAVRTRLPAGDWRTLTAVLERFCATPDADGARP